MRQKVISRIIGKRTLRPFTRTSADKTKQENRTGRQRNCKKRRVSKTSLDLVGICTNGIKDYNQFIGKLSFTSVTKESEHK